MKYGINIGINVKEIDKARLKSSGDKIFLNATVFFDTEQKDQFGNSGMIAQDVSKEEKDSGVKGNILGNIKVFWSDNQQASTQQQNEHSGNEPEEDSGIPF